MPGAAAVLEGWTADSPVKGDKPGGSGCELRFAIPKGPVRARDLYQGYEHVLAAVAEAGMQAISNGFVESLLHFGRPASIQGELDEDTVCGAPDAQEVLVGNLVLRRMLIDDLETVVLWRLQNVDHGFIDDVADGAAIVIGLALDQINASERHGDLHCR